MDRGAWQATVHGIKKVRPDLTTKPQHIFFGEMSIQILCPFLNWVVFLFLHYSYSLYILETISLSDKFKYFFPIL